MLHITRRYNHLEHVARLAYLFILGDRSRILSILRNITERSHVDRLTTEVD